MATQRQLKAKARERASPEAEVVLKAKVKERTAANRPKEKEKGKVAEGLTAPMARPQVSVFLLSERRLQEGKGLLIFS